MESIGLARIKALSWYLWGASLILGSTALAVTPYPATYCSDGHCRRVTSPPNMYFGPVPIDVHIACIDSDAYALTFDDGPSANWDEVLSILARHEVRATFFVLGNQLQHERGQDAIRRASADGHQISNHSYSHPDLLKLSSQEIVWQMQTTENLILETLGDSLEYLRDARVMRPPYGYIDERVQSVMRSISYQSVRWNSDRKDWQLNENQSDIVMRRLEQHLVFNHGLVGSGTNLSILDLNHDFSRATVLALERLIPKVQNAGYRFVTVSECLGLAN